METERIGLGLEHPNVNLHLENLPSDLPPV